MIKNVLFVGLTFSVIGLSGCASVSKTTPPPIMIEKTSVNNGLPAQELLEGECGIFLWDNAVPRAFVFFQKQGEAFAKYYDQGTAHSLETEQNTLDMANTGAIDFTYSSADYDTVILKGVLEDLLDSGQRISGSTITTKKPGAWEEIHPVSGAYVCR